MASRLERDALRAKPHTHAGFYAAHPRVPLVAGADINAGRLADFGADWRIAPDHLYADYHELLARERPDLVSICAYAPERVAMARAAIEAGARGLWLEKAVACSMTEAAELRTFAERAGVAVVVNHMRRADPAWRRVAEIVARDELGRLESVHVRFNGHFLHTGTHAWDALDEWCGPWASICCWPVEWREVESDAGAYREPGAVLSEPEAGSREPTTDPSGLAHIVFERGAHAFVSGSPKRYFTFECDLTFAAGRIQIGNDVQRIWRPTASPRYEGFVELADSGERLEGAPAAPILDALLDAVDSGRNRLVALDEATRALHLGLGVVHAARTPGVDIRPEAVETGFYVRSI